MDFMPVSASVLVLNVPLSTTVVVVVVGFFIVSSSVCAHGKPPKVPWRNRERTFDSPIISAQHHSERLRSLATNAAVTPSALSSILLFCRRPAACDDLRRRLVFARFPRNLSGSASRQINHPHQIGSQMARANCDRYQPADHRPAAFGGRGKHASLQPTSRGVCPTGGPLATGLENSFAPALEA